MNKLIVLTTLIAVSVAAELPYPSPTASYPAPAYSSYPAPPMPYSFAWAVKDEPSYNDYAHQESNDGKTTTGSYRVLLPDGRTQIVTYKADEYGYVADVKYEGVARYPEYTKPVYKQPAYEPAAAQPTSYPSSA